MAEIGDFYPTFFNRPGCFVGVRMDVGQLFADPSLMHLVDDGTIHAVLVLLDVGYSNFSSRLVANTGGPYDGFAAIDGWGFFGRGCPPSFLLVLRTRRIVAVNNRNNYVYEGVGVAGRYARLLVFLVGFWAGCGRSGLAYRWFFLGGYPLSGRFVLWVTCLCTRLFSSFFGFCLSFPVYRIV